ncbi:hypothetical protein [Geoalkalibacter halelectricus]|uniref:Uncharacterized protein n=1 Tax=Geoalkalibacter halelectricus TaxID=2847045 RepID=A0ABY5ZMM7_9BACT|nr:hypothetical protein [Geoalkalibacter halelectricus]MDO3378326.1 hypothetical protein [Geoalkalibacter halelectricus]UWZ79739.1 hypothetical protein L9S41_18970 [Geoalkalibacter halelectricus]
MKAFHLISAAPLSEHRCQLCLRPAPESGIDDWTWREGESILYRFLDGAQEREFIRMRQFLKNVSKLASQPQVHTAAVRDNGIALA